MDKALKQRLVGASVIIALVVIVLPMLLGGRPENPAQQSEKIELPARPGALAFETRRFPVDEVQSAPEAEARPAVTSATRTPAVPAESNSAPAPEAAVENTGESSPPLNQDPAGPATVEPAPVEALSVESAAEAAPQGPVSNAETIAAEVPPAVTGRYLVQVASLGSAENATKLMTALQGKGYPVLLDSVESSVGVLNRVRVGPYLSEREAAAAATEIHKAFSELNPKLVDLQPDATVAAPEGPDSLMRWVVQAGSFSDAANADRLVEQLRADGMSAYQEKVTSGSSVSFRVRIGPFLERETALKARQALSETRSIDGVVVSAD